MKTENTKCNIAGAILAGGKGSRINGLAKGALKTDDGISIVERLIAEFNKSDIAEVVIITGDREFYKHCGSEIIADLRSGFGPIAGIEAGLDYFAGRCDAVLFIPCDMPQITAGQIVALKKSFVDQGSPVVFAKTSEFFWHPLCAVVHNGLLEQASAAIDRGQLKIRQLWDQVGANGVMFEDENPFFNINSHNDLNLWQIQCEGKR